MSPSAPLLINLGILRSALEQAFDELERGHGDWVSLDWDYFWFIPIEERTNMLNPPSNFTIGQYSEIVDHIYSMIANPSVATTRDISWFGQLLVAIGELSPEYPSD